MAKINYVVRKAIGQFEFEEAHLEFGLEECGDNPIQFAKDMLAPLINQATPTHAVAPKTARTPYQQTANSFNGSASRRAPASGSGQRKTYPPIDFTQFAYKMDLPFSSVLRKQGYDWVTDDFITTFKDDLKRNFKWRFNSEDKLWYGNQLPNEIPECFNLIPNAPTPSGAHTRTNHSRTSTAQQMIPGTNPAGGLNGGVDDDDIPF